MFVVIYRKYGIDQRSQANLLSDFLAFTFRDIAASLGFDSQYAFHSFIIDFFEQHYSAAPRRHGSLWKSDISIRKMITLGGLWKSPQFENFEYLLEMQFLPEVYNIDRAIHMVLFKLLFCQCQIVGAIESTGITPENDHG